jgi:hypothetical protein
MTTLAPARRSVRRISVALAAGAMVLAALGLPGTAVADTAPPTGTPATVSADALPTWQVNGVVWSQVVVNNIVYATGSFTRARPPGVAVGGTGEVKALHLLAYDIRTGARVTSFNHHLNAQGRVVTAAPDGSRVYVGGDFTSVDGIARGHVAAFDTATGALNTSFKANVNNQVRALAATDTTLYVGGNYQAINGTARKSLGAVRTSTGSLLSWAPKVDNGFVYTMVLAPDRSRVIVGGSFTTLNGQAAKGMGSLSTSTGANLPWAANKTIRNGGSQGAITSLRTDGRQIYGSGFQYISGGNFEGTFAADPLTGNITVVNDCHGDTYDVVPLGGVLYSVGHAHNCAWIRSFPDTEPRVRWQRALAQTIAAKTTNIGPDNYGWNYNGLPASRVLHWFPQMPVGSYTGQYQAAWSIAGNSTYVVMGGEFPSVNGTKQQGLVRMAVSASAPDKQGPRYDTKPSRPVPATTATALGSGQVKVSFGTAWDYDNEALTYDVLRDNTTWIHSRQIKSSFWKVPSASFTDTGRTVGAKHYYQIRIKDRFGNTRWSPKSSTVTVS